MKIIIAILIAVGLFIMIEQSAKAPSAKSPAVVSESSHSPPVRNVGIASAITHDLNYYKQFDSAISRDPLLTVTQPRVTKPKARAKRPRNKDDTYAYNRWIRANPISQKPSYAARE